MCSPCFKKQAPPPPPPPNSEVTPPARVMASRSPRQVSVNSRLSVDSVSSVANSVLEKKG